jgi:hypothetical protein
MLQRTVELIKTNNSMPEKRIGNPYFFISHIALFVFFLFLNTIPKVKTITTTKEIILAGSSGLEAELKTTAERYVIHESTSVPIRYEAGKNRKEELTSLSLRINRKRCSQYGFSSNINSAPRRKEKII